MSDAKDDGPEFRTMNWADLHKEIEVLTQIAMDSVTLSMVEAEMIPPDQVSWLHLTGVAILLMRQALEVPGVPADHMAWAHQKLLLLHDLTHGYMEAGPAGVHAMEADMLAQREESQNPPDDSVAPPGCKLH